MVIALTPHSGLFDAICKSAFHVFFKENVSHSYLEGIHSLLSFFIDLRNLKNLDSFI